MTSFVRCARNTGLVTKHGLGITLTTANSCISAVKQHTNERCVRLNARPGLSFEPAQLQKTRLKHLRPLLVNRSQYLFLMSSWSTGRLHLTPKSFLMLVLVISFLQRSHKTSHILFWRSKQNLLPVDQTLIHHPTQFRIGNWTRPSLF